MKKKLRIATRKSPLALLQAEIIKNALTAKYPEVVIELIGFMTQADKFLETPLQNIGGKGLFVKELEIALLEKRADIAVHSIKDLPAELPEPLKLAVICEREDARDVLVSDKFSTLSDLPSNSSVGTSSLRRQCQLRLLRSDLQLHSLRGNVGSRLQKLKEGAFDAIILAAAGLNRLQLSDQIRQYFTIGELIPAIGQGALGIECRQEDHVTQEIIAFLDHQPTRQCVMAERAMNAEFGGNCQIPIGAHAYIESELLLLTGMVGSLNTQLTLRSFMQGKIDKAEELGKKLAQDLIQRGALELLKGVNPPHSS